MYVCEKCKDRFTGEAVSEMRQEHEEFSLHPFICPDCWDRLRRMDLEDQFKDLLGGGDVNDQPVSASAGGSEGNRR